MRVRAWLPHILTDGARARPTLKTMWIIMADELAPFLSGNLIFPDPVGPGSSIAAERLKNVLPRGPLVHASVCASERAWL